MEKIPLAMEGLSQKEIDLVCEIFRTGNLTMGSHVENFEMEFANFISGVTSCTNMLGLRRFIVSMR